MKNKIFFSLVIFSIFTITYTKNIINVPISLSESLEKRSERIFFYSEFSKAKNLENFLEMNKQKIKFLTKYSETIKNYWFDYQMQMTKFNQIVQGITVDNLVYRTGFFTGQVEIGTPPQNFSLVPDTGSSDLWVAGTNCTNCSISKEFNTKASSTYKSNGDSFNIQYAKGTASGFSGTDTVSISGLAVDDFVVNVADSVVNITQSSYFNGILGLGWRSTSSHTFDPSPSFVQTLKSQGIISNAVFSFYLNIFDQNLSPALIIGGTDEKYYQKTIKYYKLVTFIGIDLWAILWDGIKIQGKSYKCNPAVVIDSGTTGFLLNQVTLAEITPLFLDIACQDVPTIDVLIGSDTYSIPNSHSTYIYEGKCIIPISPLDSTVIDVLGDSFMSVYYTVFDYDNRRIGISSSKLNKLSYALLVIISIFIIFN